MGKFEWFLVAVAVVLAVVAYRSYASMGDSLASNTTKPAGPGGFAGTLGFNSNTRQLTFGGGVKL